MNDRCSESKISFRPMQRSPPSFKPRSTSTAPNFDGPETDSRPDSRVTTSSRSALVLLWIDNAAAHKRPATAKLPAKDALPDTLKIPCAAWSDCNRRRFEFEAVLTVSATDSELPSRTIARTAKLAPKSRKSQTERCVWAKMRRPMMDTLLPTRANDRTASDEPIVTKSATDMEDPMRQDAYNASLLPNLRHERVDNEDPSERKSHTAKLDPDWAFPYNEQALPNLEEPRTDIADPNMT
mmetsp:Transcript_93866/g.251187  ORF Transcript_93866/g.251187 Transcript_93866/m.251187 type:complete len:239 (+) Transcript_93866:1303-2019(+)